MSFLKKIKNSMGIGTIKFTLVVPTAIEGGRGQLEGDIILTAKSEQSVKDVEVWFKRIHRWDQRESVYNSSTQRYNDEWVSKSQSVELGHCIDSTAFDLKAEETKTIHFSLAFAPINPQYANGGGPMGDGFWASLGNSFLSGPNIRNERIEYEVSGDVDLEDVAFDKGSSQRVTIV